jgi:hypothetical protein
MLLQYLQQGPGFIPQQQRHQLSPFQQLPPQRSFQPPPQQQTEGETEGDNFFAPTSLSDLRGGGGWVGYPGGKSAADAVSGDVWGGEGVHGGPV